MRTFTDTVLATAGRISGQLGPVTSLIDSVVERIAPKATAQACSGCYCGSDCASCAHGITWVDYYAASGYDCTIGNYSCAIYGPCGNVC